MQEVYTYGVPLVGGITLEHSVREYQHLPILCPIHDLGHFLSEPIGEKTDPLMPAIKDSHMSLKPTSLVKGGTM